MKKRTLKTSLFFRLAMLIALLASAMTAVMACNSNQSTTDNGNLGENPQWLNQVIQQLKNEPVANPPASVTRYEYKDQNVYYVPPQYADIWSTLYDANGNIIGHPDGGITGNGDGRVQDFFDKRKNGVTIWSDARKYDTAMVKDSAPITSIEISIAESYPPQYFVKVISGMPNSCVKYGGYYLNRNGNTINIEMINWKPAAPNTQCAEVYTEKTTNIPLGTDFQTGTTYTVEVNGKTETFTGQ